MWGGCACPNPTPFEAVEGRIPCAEAMPKRPAVRGWPDRPNFESAAREDSPGTCCVPPLLWPVPNNHLTPFQSD